MNPITPWNPVPKMTVVAPSGPIKYTKNKRPFKDCLEKEHAPDKLNNDLASWLTDLSTYSSLHGIGWSTRTKNRMFQGLVFLGAVFICISLPVVLVIESIKFSQDDRMETAVEWQKAKTIAYPNITVCYSKFFDKRRLAKMNISNDMANYMTLALDFGLAEYFNFMKTSNVLGSAMFESTMTKLELDLDEILHSSNLSLIELYREVAIRCEDFISYCEVHREFYISMEESPGPKSENFTAQTCCQTFFTQPPFFNHGGTCFTTQRPIVETYPSIFSSIRIWLAADEGIAPEFDMMFKGSDAAERRGISWALSTKDHPSQILSVAPQRASRGSLQIIGLEKIEA